MGIKRAGVGYTPAPSKSWFAVAILLLEGFRGDVHVSIGTARSGPPNIRYHSARTSDGELAQVRLQAMDDYQNRLHDMRDKARKARLSDLQSATPEERRERYRELELRVVALSKEELEVSGIFGVEKFYILEPASR